MRTDTKFVIGFVLLVLGAVFGLMVAEFETREPHFAEGVVTHKSHVPATSSTGVGISGGGNPVVVSSSSSAQWLVFVEIDGENFKVNVHEDDWHIVKEGTHVKVKWLVSCFGAGPLRLAHIFLEGK